MASSKPSDGRRSRRAAWNETGRFGAWRFLAGLATPSKARNLSRLRARGEETDAFRIREASATYVPALTWLHVTTWNATYAPLLMKGPSYNVRERQWREVFAKNENGWFCFVVERPDGELVAFAQGSRSDDVAFRRRAEPFKPGMDQTRREENRFGSRNGQLRLA